MMPKHDPLHNQGLAGCQYQIGRFSRCPGVEIRPGGTVNISMKFTESC
jgi:hypothetical protein